MKYAPIATKHNNRYRGPVESIKDVAFDVDLIKNISFLKVKINEYQSELNHLNKKVKSNAGVYDEAKNIINQINHKTNMCEETLNNM